MLFRSDCGTDNAITASAAVNDGEVVSPLSERVLGRTAAEDVLVPGEDAVIVRKNEIIDERKADEIEAAFARTNTTGFIHIGAQWAASLVQSQLMIKSGSGFVSPLGHRWVIGGGYVNTLRNTVIGTSASSNAPASVNMWPASEINASDPDQKPPPSSTRPKPPVSSKAHSKRRWVASWW